MTWKIGGKEEICCNIELRLQLEEKKWEEKRSRHKIETYEGKKTTNKIVTKKSKSQHVVIIQTGKWSQPKTDVATQKLEEEKDNDVATCN